MEDEQLNLNINNLYSNGRIVVFKGLGDLLVRDKIDFIEHSTNKYHEVHQGDLLSTIAYQYYNDKVEDSSKFWWVIADVNNIINPLDISHLVGKRIIVPDILRVLVEI